MTRTTLSLHSAFDVSVIVVPSVIPLPDDRLIDVSGKTKYEKKKKYSEFNVN